MTLSLDGLRYFQTYDWLFLRSVVTAGYIGWCVFCLQFVIRNFVLSPRSNTKISAKSRFMVRMKYMVWLLQSNWCFYPQIDVLSVTVLAGLSTMLYIQKMPLMYHAYVFFPVYFWNQILRNYRSLFEALNVGLRHGIARFFIILTGSLLFLEALVSIDSIYLSIVYLSIFIGLQLLLSWST